MIDSPALADLYYGYVAQEYKIGLLDEIEKTSSSPLQQICTVRDSSA
ncbi:MAG TPA: hypothetical protein VJZ27_15090 [Aggregatilineales bacterium]|nr:hypothetical protein [Aggregatilineales bacterium]